MAMGFDGVAEQEIEYALGVDYEHEHRFTEHEHEEEPEQNVADEGLGQPCLTHVASTPGLADRPRYSSSANAELVFSSANAERVFSSANAEL
jgi:hypothetical protein